MSVSSLLNTVATFNDLPAETLAWLATHGELHDYADGAVIASPGDEAHYLMAVLAGTVQYYVVRGGNREPVFRLETGQVGGVLPYSRLRVVKGKSVAVGNTRLFQLHRDAFPALEQQSPELTMRLVNLMSDRARTEARGQERDDKLRALG
ncbi:Crp/Fnr family transcriptional regulator, partial [Hymenobacter terrestris]